MKLNRYKYYIPFFSVLFFSAVLSAQKSENLWKQTIKESVVKEKQLLRNSEPSKSAVYKLDITALILKLKNIPNRKNFKGASNVIVQFPTENGVFESFRIKEASILSPELQAMFPEIRSYIGEGIENPSAIIRFSISPEKGLSSMLLSNAKTVFIEPFSKDLSTYIVYKNSSSDKNNSALECETKNIANKFNISTKQAINANDGKLRTFRLALACTGEYASFHGGTKAGALAAMNTTMTRVNAIFERDVAITMVMVDNTSILFLNGATDPYTNDDGSKMLDENQTAIDTNIGFSNYDIGHVFSTGGGGVAYLNSPCGSSKAGGVTGSSSPTGDTFDIDFVVHEMGHQYGANHTQNNDCQRTAVSVEPGSASTIMGYAGICSPNVQSNSDDYFHGENIREMWANITSGASQCASLSNTGNTAPVANAGSNYTIPKSTPFILRGGGSDVDSGNSLTYCWEQMDPTPVTMPPVSTSTNGPAFRSLLPKTSPNRYMPNLATVLGGTTASMWEVVPSVERTMNFALTVRDNVLGGASTDTDAMIVTVNGTAGPFLVTSQTTENISWASNTTETITWDIAGTTGNSVNTANVNILLSTDGGANFDIVLASNTPNDGSQNIIVPNFTFSNCRIMVEAVGNIFFAVNSERFSIGNFTTSCTLYASAENLNLAIPDNTGLELINTINIPDSNIIDYIKVNVDVSHSYVNDLIIQIQHPNGSTSTSVWNRNCNDEDGIDIIFEDGATVIDCVTTSPPPPFIISGTYAPASPLDIFSGLDAIGDWKISILDNADADIGILNDWYIEVCSTTLDSIQFKKITYLFLFPNPNKGEFTVQLNSNSGNDVTISVYDIRGRRIFDEQYGSSSNFLETINLSQVQSGLYLVIIKDGNKTTTKKIIIE